MREWYLMNEHTSPNMLGGYENQSFNDFKDDAFLETLETDIADTVILYNYNLSNSKEIRAIIQDNTADTQLKSMERTILAPIGTFTSGDYVFFEDEFWIVDGRPGNNKIYEKVTLKECQYLLRWQDDDGNIIERWANFASASKYDVGEIQGRTIILTSNNLTVIIPNDKESLSIDGKRVFIDLNESNPTKVFKITRNDDILFNHNGHGGTLSLIADKTELNIETDNQELRICDYIAPLQKEQDSNKNIICFGKISYRGNNIIVAGGNAKTFSFQPLDINSNPIEYNNYTWDLEVSNNVDDFVNITISQDNKCKIKVDYNDLIVGETIRIIVKDENNVEITSEDIEIGGGL